MGQRKASTRVPGLKAPFGEGAVKEGEKKTGGPRSKIKEKTGGVGWDFGFFNR